MATESSTAYHSTHRRIIDAIHSYWFSGEPFGIWQVRDTSGVSTSSVIRTVKMLVRLRMLSHSKRAYAGKHYRVTGQWPAKVTDAIDAFEYAKILKI